MDSRSLPDKSHDPQPSSPAALLARLHALTWPSIQADLDAQGWCVLPTLLTPPECAELAALYARAELFRKQIQMAKHGYGRGEYKYFDYPLPALVAELRAHLYPPLARVANQWHGQLGLPTGFPEDHAAFLARCHQSGQTRPTPLLLKYAEGDYNRLHQDLYGEHVFPLQVALLLSRPGADFEGGEFVLTEQRPRMQSRPSVVPLAQGDAVVFAVNMRPEPGARGFHRVVMRHGVSALRKGTRSTLGVIFHDAQ
jgi:hypothetical protein